MPIDAPPDKVMHIPTEGMRTMADATLKQIMEFFGMNAAQFQKAWKELTDTDKAQLKAGIGDGSLTY